MNQPKFIILPSVLEDIDLMVQDNLRVYDHQQMINYKRQVNETLDDLGPMEPFKYIDLRQAFFAPDVYFLFKRMVEVGQDLSSAEGMDELNALEIQAIELVKKIEKAFQQ